MLLHILRAHFKFFAYTHFRAFLVCVEVKYVVLMVWIWLNTFLSIKNNVSNMQIVFVHHNVVNNDWWIQGWFTHKWKFSHNLLALMLFQTCHVILFFSMERNRRFFFFIQSWLTVGVMLQKRTKPFYKNSSYALCHVIALCEVTPNTNLGMLHQVGSHRCQNAVGFNMSCKVHVMHQIKFAGWKSNQSSQMALNMAYESYGLLFLVLWTKWTMNWHCIKMG